MEHIYFINVIHYQEKRTCSVIKFETQVQMLTIESCVETKLFLTSKLKVKCTEHAVM